jgi:hypothetical protein
VIDLEKFDIGAMLELNRGLTESCREVVSEEDFATRVAHWFRENLTARGRKACALARYYKAMAHAELPAPVQGLAQRIAPAIKPTNLCLALLGTAGEEEAWNDRRRSQSHQAIPLVSRDFIERAPMMSQLLHQFGVELDWLVGPTPSLVDAREREFNVFHVEEASGSPFVPGQNFVRDYGVKSVLGLGAMMPGGGFFAVILFVRARIDRATAQRFRPVPLTLKASLLRASVPVFTPTRPAGH